MAHVLAFRHPLRARFLSEIATALRGCLAVTLAVAAGMALPAGRVQAQSARPAVTPTNYTSIVIFGDSLSDTGNDAAVSSAKYTVNAQVPGPASGYTNGRFTDGLDTLPAARNYTGVWIEQLAAKLTAHPVVLNSLAGGSNYAYGFATTAMGTTTFTYGPGNALSFPVNNVGLQVTNYLAGHPTITPSTLFVVWAGANDLIAASSTQDIINAATRDVGIVQQLIAAGATNIVVPNLPPLGLVPRFNGTAAVSAQVSAAALGFNQALAVGLGQLAAATAGAGVHLYSLDTYTLFNTIVAEPTALGFANVTASSQLNVAANPDTYLFWDDLHPTTFGHSLLAAAAATLIGPGIGTSVSIASSNGNANLNAPVTFTATIAGSGGVPMGPVYFMDGMTTLGTALALGTTSTTTATFTTATLGAGTHTITAAFNGVNGYGSAVSPVYMQTVTPPSFAAALSPATITVPRGAAGMTTLSLTPAGGYTGSFTIACGTVPAHFACTPLTTALSITGTAAVTSSIVFDTNLGTAQLVSPTGTSDGALLCGVIGLPLLGCIAFRRRYRGRVALLTLLFAAVVFGMSGCGSGSSQYANDAASGTYTVPIVVTPASGAATTVTLTVVVQ